MILRAFGLLLIATTSAHAGASFDCRKARAPVEIAICGTPATADLDGEVAAAYKAAQQKLAGDAAALSALVSAQKEFVTTRNKSFGQPGYDLARHLSQRLGELKQGAASAPAATAPDIATYFKLVPLSVFDTTTDGLETEEERALLLQKGKSENWIYTRLAASRASLRATHPSSEVTMTVMNLGQPVLQVHVQNEKAETITYWTQAAGGKPLQQHTRAPRFRPPQRHGTRPAVRRTRPRRASSIRSPACRPRSSRMSMHSKGASIGAAKSARTCPRRAPRRLPRRSATSNATVDPRSRPNSVASTPPARWPPRRWTAPRACSANRFRAGCDT